MLAPRDGAVYLDGTFGGGGYTRAILDHARCEVWAIDRDEAAIARGAGLAALYPGRLHLLHGRLWRNADVIDRCRRARAGRHRARHRRVVVPDRRSVARVLVQSDGPLDMRMQRGPDAAMSHRRTPARNTPRQNPGRGMGQHGTAGKQSAKSAAHRTAATLVNTLPERDLADLLYELGEERASRRVAHAIVTARAEAPIVTTGRLASIIRAVLPPDKSGHHPATRSFQALRLSVNDELGEIERGLAQAARLVGPGGRIVVVSFHSLEDRIVKRFMTEVSGRSPAPSRHDPRGLGPTAAAVAAPGSA